MPPPRKIPPRMTGTQRATPWRQASTGSTHRLFSHCDSVKGKGWVHHAAHYSALQLIENESSKLLRERKEGKHYTPRSPSRVPVQRRLTLAVARRFMPLSMTTFSFYGDEDGGGALIPVLMRSGDTVDEQVDEAHLPHLVRKRAQRSRVLGEENTTSSARTTAMAALVQRG
jgi:hypothetical protein